MSNPTNITSEGASKKFVPELRFPEFVNEGEWEEYKLDDVAEFFKGKGISKQEVVSNGKVPCIRYGELYTTYNEVIDKVKSSTNIPINELFVSKANDVIIPSSGETKEDISTASCVLDDDIAIGGDINVLRTNQNGVFLSYYLNCTKKNDIARIAQGISIIHLYNEQLRTLKVSIPSLAEQQMIAQCISTIDELIAATKEKVELLKEHKRGLMQKLFPVKGKTLPELRFPEFKNDGEWEEVYLGDVFTERNESNCTSLPLLSIGQDGVYPQSESNKRDISNKDKSKYKRICPNDIGYNTMRMWQGRSALSQIEGIVSPAYTIITPKKGLDPLFLSILLKLPYMVRDFHSHSQGLVNDTLNCKFNDFAKVKAKIPTLMEQQKIATILSSLDDEIEQYSEKVKALELHKKGLMQKLFPKKL